MARPPRDPQVDLGALRRSIGLSTDSAARLVGVTPSVLVHYESKGFGYDPEHDHLALEMYMHWAIAAHCSRELYQKVFGEPVADKKNGPVAPGPFQSPRKATNHV